MATRPTCGTFRAANFAQVLRDTASQANRRTERWPAPSRTLTQPTGCPTATGAATAGFVTWAWGAACPVATVTVRSCSARATTSSRPPPRTGTR
jgi:hypothetical protein